MDRQPAIRTTPLIAWLALVAAIVCGIALRLAHHDDITSRSPDERLYTYRAQQIADNGFGVMRPWFAEYAVNRALWEQTPITRVGYVFVLASIMKITGVKDFTPGTSVSLACSILSLFVVAWIGVRFLHVWIAVLGVTFLAFEVGPLGMARRAWSDSFFGFLGLLILYLTFEIMRNPRRVFLYPLFLAAGTYAILTKETSVMSYGICGLWVFGLLVWKERSGKRAALLALGGVASVGIAYSIWAMLAGSWAIPFQALFHVKVASPWGELNTSGPWYQFPYLLWLVGPLTAVMAVVGIIATALPRRARERVGATDLPLALDGLPVARLSALMVAAFVLFTSFVGQLQYLRMLSPVDGVYCLLAGFGLCSLLTMARRSFSETGFRALVLLAILAVAIEGVRDYRIYTSVVVRLGMEDLTAIWIRGALHR